MKTRICTGAIVILVVSLALCLPAAADSIYFSPSHQTVPTSTSVSVDVYFERTVISNGHYLGAFDITVGWDDSILNLASAEWDTSLFGDPLFVFDSWVPTGNSVNLAVGSLLTSLEDLQGRQLDKQIPLLTLFFNTGTKEGYSPLTLSSVVLSDDNGEALTASLVNGGITVGTAPVPEPASILLALTGLGASAANCLRRKKA